MCIDLLVKYLLCLPDFNQTCIFLTHFQKNHQMSNLMKIHPVGAEMLHVDAPTDKHTTKLSLFAILQTHLKKAPQRKIITDP